MRIKIFTIAIIAIFMYSEAISEEFDVRVRLTIDNTFASDSLLEFGAVSSATDGLDAHLGEIEIPPFPPPAFDIFAIFNLDTTNIDGLFSYKDFRSVPADENEFHHRYKIELNKRVPSVATISWGKLPDYVKSARIYDELNLLFSADMKTTNSVVINNENLPKIPIYIDVVYTKVPTSVTQDNENFAVYPNPSNGWISLSNSEKISKIEIYNELSEIVFNTNSLSSEKINLVNLQNGVYFIKIIDINNNFYFNKLLINR
ncbi:MAG: T9SS type A sorting domain-containing protein [Ignavibacteria bacterium]|nr:T9SS type A sorting domain-containing protein [Ignavibacteria bacterium]